METSMAVFRGKGIRKTIHNNEWWFSVVDVCAILTESADPGAYWRKLKQRLKKEGSEVVTFCHGLKLVAPDGKFRKTDCANTEGIFRIIQESKLAAHKGGEVAGKARKDLEQKTRKKVVSPENYLDIPQKRRQQLNEKE
jgi:prophage antirepressor-like protein